MIPVEDFFVSGIDSPVATDCGNTKKMATRTWVPMAIFLGRSFSERRYGGPEADASRADLECPWSSENRLIGAAVLQKTQRIKVKYL